MIDATQQGLVVVNSIVELKSEYLRRGRTLVDTGSQVSLVKESSLCKDAHVNIKPSSAVIQGVTGNALDILGTLVSPLYDKTFKSSR